MMTTRACQLLIACALTVAVLASQEVLSDQTAAELPDLFEQLQSSPSPELARNFEQEIWRLWLEGPTDDAGNSLARARIAMSMGDLDQAEASLTALIKLAPTFAEARNQRALLWFLRENYPAALSDIDETLALEPRHFGALSGRGQCYLRMNQPEAALAAFEDALAVHPWLADVSQNAQILKTFLNGKNQGI